jgi:hypothetical protein
VRCLVRVSFFRVRTMRKRKRKFTDELKTMHVSEMTVTSGKPNACLRTYIYISPAQGLNVEFVMKRAKLHHAIKSVCLVCKPLT